VKTREFTAEDPRQDLGGKCCPLKIGEAKMVGHETAYFLHLKNGVLLNQVYWGYCREGINFMSHLGRIEGEKALNQLRVLVGSSRDLWGNC